METYTPVNCTFYDYMEHFCIRKAVIPIVYKEGHEQKTLENQSIVDLSGGSKGEYIHVMVEGEMRKIRMDQLISVGEIYLKDFDPKTCATDQKP